MAETVGIRKSSVSREFVEMSGRELRVLCERRMDVGGSPQRRSEIQRRSGLEGGIAEVMQE